MLRRCIARAAPKRKSPTSTSARPKGNTKAASKPVVAAAPKVPEFVPRRVLSVKDKHVNGLTLLPFQPHNRDFLAEQVEKLPYKDTLTPDEKLGHMWVDAEAAEAIFQTKLKAEFASVQPIVLPAIDLPARVGVDGESTIAFPERKLFHATMFEAPCVQTEELCEKRRYRNPRCGQTGLYFSCEEIAASLNHSFIRNGFSSNFWITEAYVKTNPRLQFIAGATPTAVRQCARIYIAPTEVEVPENLLKQHKDVVNWDLGMNAVSKMRTENLAVRKLIAETKQEAFWVSQDQVEFFGGIRLRSGVRGRTAELTISEYFNQDNLESPGRLALKPNRWHEQFF